jgi:RNA polymerase sigma factor (TIGR02999 family)
VVFAGFGEPIKRNRRLRGKGSGPPGQQILPSEILSRERISRVGLENHGRSVIIRASYRTASQTKGEAMIPASQDVTRLLVDWSNGDQAALEKLLPLVNAELRQLARRYMRRESPGHTLQTSALVNEAYLRLIDQRNVQWQNRAHFFGIAAQLMRRILIDHARSHHYAKRGGGALRVSLDEAAAVTEARAAELLAVDEALEKLTTMDARKGRIVELRFFGGLTEEETAEVMGISSPTVQREWRAAKAWLRRMLTDRKDDEV